MACRQLLLISSSNVHGYGYLEATKSLITNILNKNNVKQLLFVPYALRHQDEYTNQVAKVLNKWGYDVDSIDRHEDPIEAISKAKTIFIGGDNAFKLLKGLHDNNLIDPIRRRVLTDGVPYIGSSAGTNVAARRLHTTHSMPIVYPPSLQALNLVPFNIDPHFLDTDETSTHEEKSSEVHILQYQQRPESKTVLGLREGSALMVDGDNAVLKGFQKAKLFIRGQEPKEIDIGTDLSYLVKE